MKYMNLKLNTLLIDFQDILLLLIQDYKAPILEWICLWDKGVLCESFKKSQHMKKLLHRKICKNPTGIFIFLCYYLLVCFLQQFCSKITQNSLKYKKAILKLNLKMFYFFETVFKLNILYDFFALFFVWMGIFVVTVQLVISWKVTESLCTNHAQYL